MTGFIVSKLKTYCSKFKQQSVAWRIVFVITIFITLIKVLLAGKGFLAFPDESLYHFPGKILQSIAQKDISALNHNIFQTKGRPGYSLVYIIPNALQFVTAQIFKLNYYETNNSYPLFFFNFIIYVLLLKQLYRLSFSLIKNSFWALFAVFIYASLTNSYVYLRHALPYDCALFIFMLLINKIILHLRNKYFTTPIQLSFYGFLAYFGFLVYPGYYYLFFVVFYVLLFFPNTIMNFKQKIFSAFYFGVGAIICIALFEMLSLIDGQSFHKDMVRISGIITQGSFDESYTYILKYYLQVEGVSGIICLTGLTVFVIKSVLNLVIKRDNNYYPIFSIGLITFFLFLIHASSGYFFHKIVFYGRLLHQFTPFICIFAALGIFTISQTFKKGSLLYIPIGTLMLYSFTISFIEYLNVAYPRDVAWLLSKKYNIYKINSLKEYQYAPNEIPSIKEFRMPYPPNQPDSISTNVILVNCTFLFPVEDYSKYVKLTIPQEYQLFYNKLHFLMLKAYQFEGSTIQERKNLEKMQMYVRVYKK